MSSLERITQPILIPMIEGRQRELGALDSKIVRTWATKTALQFAYASEQGFTQPIDPDYAHRLFARRDDFSRVLAVQVWVAAYDPLGQFAYRYMTAQGYGVHPKTGANIQVVRVIFIAGHAVFYVRLPSGGAQRLGWRKPSPQFTPLRNLEAERAVLWRKEPLDDLGISEAFNRHIHGGIYAGQDADLWHGLD